MLISFNFTALCHNIHYMAQLVYHNYILLFKKFSINIDNFFQCSQRLEQYLRNKTSRWHTLDAGCTRYIYHKHLILTLAARWLQMVQLFKHSVTFTDAIQLRASYYHLVNINKRYIVTSWITANMQSSCNVPKSQSNSVSMHFIINVYMS